MARSLFVMIDNAERVEDFHNLSVELDIRLMKGTVSEEMYARYKGIISEKIKQFTGKHDEKIYMWLEEE